MPDGRLVVGTSSTFDIQDPQRPGLLIVRPEDPRNPQRIPLDGLDTISPSAVTRDGRHVVFTAERVDQARSEVMLLDLQHSKPETLTPPGRFNERCAVISPDGRWLAYESDVEDRVTYRIFVRPFRDAKGGERPVPGLGGVQPVWSRNGDEKNGDKLFYATRQGEFWSVSVPRHERWNPGAPVRLFPTPAFLTLQNRDHVSSMYDVSKDGRFLIVIPGPPDPEARPPHILWKRNWTVELETLVASY